MIYTILTAVGNRYIVNLDKHGNKYTTGVWDKKEHVSKTFYHDSYDEAELNFNLLKIEYDAPYNMDLHLDESDFVNID